MLSAEKHTHLLSHLGPLLFRAVEVPESLAHSCTRPMRIGFIHVIDSGSRALTVSVSLPTGSGASWRRSGLGEPGARRLPMRGGHRSATPTVRISNVPQSVRTPAELRERSRRPCSFALGEEMHSPCVVVVVVIIVVVLVPIFTTWYNATHIVSKHSEKCRIV